MPTRTFIEFRKNIFSKLKKNTEHSRAFRKLLGKTITELIPEDTAHDKLVEQAIELTGATPGRKNIDLTCYGHTLIANNLKNGTGSFDVSLALYYLLLRLKDSSDYVYNDCIVPLDEFIFGKGNSFAQEFPDFPLPAIPFIQSSELELSWTLFLEKHARFKDIEIELEPTKKRGLSITDIKSVAPVFDKVIEVGQGFQFLLDIPFVGIGLAFSGNNFKTYPMRFSHDQLLFKVQGEELIFPEQQKESQKVFLTETEDEETQYTFVIANHNSGKVLMDISQLLKVGTAIAPERLDRLAHDLTTTKGRVEVRQIVAEFQHKKSRLI